MNRRRLRGAAIVAAVGTASAARGQPVERSLGPTVLHKPLQEKHAEQGILTPVPIGIELPADLAARRVLVHYKLFGAPTWETLELKPVGRRYAGAISCMQVSTVTGDIVYYVRVHDKEGTVIAYSGSRSSPYRVKIINDTRAGAAAGRCPDPADCPPGLPGCPSERVERIPCKSNVDCEGGMTCGWDGFCEIEKRRRNWISIEGEGGIGLVSTSGACSVESQENEGYACYREIDGETYTASPVLTNEPIGVGRVPTRLAIGYERLVFFDTSVGARIGYAIVGIGPTARGGVPFVPFNAELRVVHWFGQDPFARLGVRPYVALSAGYGMFDTRVRVRVRTDPTVPGQGGNDLEQSLNVWKRAGDAYVGLGAGAVWAFDASYGLSCEARVIETFPFATMAATVQVGIRRGF